MLKRKRSVGHDEVSKRRSPAFDREASPKPGPGRLRDCESSPELGLTTPPPARRTFYESLKRPQLEQLLRDRGVTPQHQNKRNKSDFVQRLLEFDRDHPASPLARSLGRFQQKSLEDLTYREIAGALKLRGLKRKSNSLRSKADLLQRLRNFDAGSREAQTPEEQSVPSNSETVFQKESTASDREDASQEQRAPSNSETVFQIDSTASDRKDASQEHAIPEPPEADNIVYESSPANSPPSSPPSSPPALRQPARWMEQSPSPTRPQSDIGSDGSAPSSPTGSPQPPDRGASVADSTDTTSNADDGEDEPKADPIDVARIPSPPPPYVPPSAQPEPVPVPSPSSPEQLKFSASQPLIQPATQLNGTAAPYASQSAPTSLRRASSGLGRLPRPGQLYTSLKDLLGKTRDHTSSTSRTVLPNGSVNQKNKLPDALLEDEGTSEESGSDEDS